MSTLRKVVFFLIPSVLVSATTSLRSDGGQAGASDSRRPIVLTVQRTKGHLKLQLQPNPAPNKDILRGLQLLFDERGPDYPVVALIDGANAKAKDFSILSEFAGKAQFRNLYIFLADYQRGLMGEVQFCSGQPISRAPSLNSACNSAK